MKTYWKGIEELKAANEQLNGNEFSEELPIVMKRNENGRSRRNFLKTFGFTIAGAAVAASCERPVKKAIPFLIKPEEITPGKSNYYASTFYNGEHYQPILVKVRDGRPIKIEGNDLVPGYNGATSGIVQASVLELYDNNRFRGPLKEGKEIDWESADKEISDLISSAEGKVVLLSGSIISPSTRKVIDEFLQEYDQASHVVYDPISCSAILEANDISFGIRQIPGYRFDCADIILSFAADFLGTWISPTEYARQYSSGRKPSEQNPRMSRHIQVEAGMSLTGSNADERISIRPSAEKAMIANLLAGLMKRTGIGVIPADLPPSPVDVEILAEDLLKHRGKALVICGSNDPDSQLMVNGINDLLDSYGSTIDLAKGTGILQGDDRKMAELLSEMQDGKVSGMIFLDSNPVYDYPDAEAFRQGMEQLEFSVSFSYTRNETSLNCTFICPDHHYLESWNDALPATGSYSLGQPAIRHIFNTRQAQDSLLAWQGRMIPFDEYLKSYWAEQVYPLSDGSLGFEQFWIQCLHDGFFNVEVSAPISGRMNPEQITTLLSRVEPLPAGGTEIALYHSPNIGSGKHANNPWLQETPDPVSKVVWDNYAAVSPKFAEEKGLESGDLIRINNEYEIPVLIQPGQMYGTISVALGYGREEGGKASIGTGRNFYPLVHVVNGRRIYHANIDFEITGENTLIASTQMHHSMEGRALVRETTLEEYKSDPASGNEMHEEIEHHLDSLYEPHKFEGHHWGMSVDLNSCIGCNACVVACTAENNIPVVGKEQVAMGREMHWIRIDRYYKGDPEQPEVLRQPVMCQHCDNAPCENVCPVAATTQSSEGVNQMIYNRCVGTRYCNNNCPYKVRRFNWLDFNKADAIPKNTRDPMELSLDLPRMVLNPDVTVRAKGVMEKCTFCLQRVQEKKLTAKLEKRPLKDGEIRTACQQVCPTQAITFGDLNDKKSQLVANVDNPRSYHLLEELHVLPSVSYLTNIRNKQPGIIKEAKPKHH